MNQGKPSSLTSIAFNTGVTLERERILALPFWHETFETPGLEDDHVSEGCVTCHNIALIKEGTK